MRDRRIISGTTAVAAITLGLFASGCKPGSDTTNNATGNTSAPVAAKGAKRPASDYLSQPLVSEIYTADPSAHVWNGTLYVYPSHDIDGPAPEDDLGGHFEMRDYRVLSMTEPDGKVTVHPVALDVKQVPWADKQM